MKREYGQQVGTCDTCGKQRYINRKAAKKAMTTAHPGAQLSVYRCGEYYHYGHTPYGVKRGWQDRNTSQMYSRQWWMNQDITSQK